MAHTPPQPDKLNRTIVLAIAVAVAAGVVVGGYLLGGHKGGSAASSPSPLVSPVGSASAAPSPSETGSSGKTPKPSKSASPGGSPTASPTASPTGEPPVVLTDGRYFVYAKGVSSGSTRSLTFDLATFLIGDDANVAAAAHGDPTPVPNDFYIVNDNPLLRTYPVSQKAAVQYIAPGTSQLKEGTVDGWAAAINGKIPTDYPGTKAPYWVWITGGKIVRIQQQYLP